MADLIVIVPSRGRPEAAAELAQTFTETRTAATFLVFAVDEDDPARAEYETVGDGRHSGVLFAPSHTMVEALNQVAMYYASTGEALAIGFMGDDHRPRTEGWDARYLETLRDLGTGIVYGNDLFQGGKLPTQCAMTADIVRTLGYMAPPALTHLYCDNFWRDLGEQAGCLRYLPDVVVEHLHPFAGKATWDAGYARVNDSGMYSKDRDAYATYQREQFAGAVAAVRALR